MKNFHLFKVVDTGNDTLNIYERFNVFYDDQLIELPKYEHKVYINPHEINSRNENYCLYRKKTFIVDESEKTDFRECVGITYLGYEKIKGEKADKFFNIMNRFIQKEYVIHFENTEEGNKYKDFIKNAKLVINIYSVIRYFDTLKEACEAEFYYTWWYASKLLNSKVGGQRPKGDEYIDGKLIKGVSPDSFYTINRSGFPKYYFDLKDIERELGIAERKIYKLCNTNKNYKGLKIYRINNQLEGGVNIIEE